MDLLPETAYCDLAPATWLLFSENVPAIVYYSHLPNLTISFLLALFVLFQNPRGLPNRILFSTVLAFITWVFFAQIFWATNRSDLIMFAWSIDILVEPLVHIGILYLLYTLIEKRDAPFYLKILFAIIYAPIAILLPTSFTLSDFDLVNCLATEGPIALYYTYFVELVATITLIIYVLSRYKRAVDRKVKKEIFYLGSGGILLLLAFSWGNIIGSFTENWELGQYGLFGMPLFIGFLVYSIVNFGTFKIKIFGTQALVVATWCMLFSLLFINTPETLRWVIGLNLVFFSILGYQLILSVRREIIQRERNEALAKDLAKANARLRKLDQLKSEFVSIASHQLRSPLTSIRGYTSMILEGSYGKLGKKVTDIISRIQTSSRYMALTVEDFLNVSRIESGTMKYAPSDFDICDMVKTVYEDIKPAVTEKQLDFTFVSNIKGICTVHADAGKVRQIIQNLIDNATKYTPKGSISVILNEEKTKNQVEIVIKDTGIGMAPETLHEIFHKFARAKNANSVNVIGSGLGLYVAKEMAEKMGGSIKAASEGEGKGSTFTIYLPLEKQGAKSSK